MNLENKTVILGISASIAAYKMADVASALAKQHCAVHTIMTPNATEIITPLTFATLTGHNCITDTFDKTVNYNVAHVSLAKQADVLLIAPATANVIAKLAHGLADDMLTTTVLACNCPKLAAPAMNTKMYENPVTQDNLATLQRYGWEIIQPASGRLACGAVGKGKMPEPEELLAYVDHAVGHEKDMEGLRVLVTAGPTQEALDPVRYLTNHSTGTMGYAIAKAAASRGATVTLVSGPTQLSTPVHVERVDIRSAQDMFEAVTSRFDQQDIVIKAAAVADYRPAVQAEEKMKKSGDDLALELVRTQDILAWLGQHKAPGQFLCGFSMETQDMVENSRKKLEKKNLDLIAANNLKQEGAGFGTATNVLTLIDHQETVELPLMSKEAAAHALLDRILEKRS